MKLVASLNTSLVNWNRNWNWKLGAWMLLLCACLGATPNLKAAGAAIKEGDVFPDLAQFPLEGTVPANLKGKIVVIDFWASWCGPCKESFPVMEEVYSRFSKQGLVILAVNVDESRAAMDDFLKEHPVTFTVIRDAKKKLVAKANIQSMPTSFVLDGEGKVVSVHKGFHGAETRKKYLKEIEDLLKQTTGKNP